MKREIKFRVWDSYLKVMHHDMHLYHELITQLANGKDRYIPLQFVGLKDKNGVEIYEGDMMLVQDYNSNYPIKYVVVFNDDAAFRMRYVDRFVRNEGSFYDGAISRDAYSYKVYEVIGNIYQHPHLLTPSQVNEERK